MSTSHLKKPPAIKALCRAEASDSGPRSGRHAVLFLARVSPIAWAGGAC